MISNNVKIKAQDLNVYYGKKQALFNVNLDIHSKNPNNIVFTEVWDSKEHYDKYFAFRLEDGTITAIQNMCSEGPEVRIFDITGA